MGSAQHNHHSPAYYVKIWAILLVLLVVSILGPELNIKAVTLITAFGIAIVKAYMVAAYFMHLNIEKRFTWYLLLAMVLAMFVFFFGTAPDVMTGKGQNWIHQAGQDLIEQHKTGAATGAHAGGQN